MATNYNSFNSSVTTLEDTSIILKLSDFVKNDNPVANNSLRVQITTPESNGALKYFNGTDWVNVSGKQVISAADIAAGKLMFVPDKDENGKDYTSIGFKVMNARGDTSSTGSLKINVTAVNDAAVISGESTGVITEDSGSYVVGGKLTASDIDSAATFDVQSNVKGEYGKFSISKDGSWSYTADNAKLQGLGGDNAAVTETFTVETKDGTAKEIVVTLQGVNEVQQGSRNKHDNDDSHHGDSGRHDNEASHHDNDDHDDHDEHEESEHNQGGTVNHAPTVLAPLASTAAEGTASWNMDLLAGASDVDSGDTLNVGSIITYSVDGAPAGTTPPAGVTLTGSSLNVDPTNEAFNHLAVGQSMIILVSYSVIDTKGASVMQTETITVTGTNDAPVAAVATAAATEDNSMVSGVVTSTDADAGATATYALDVPVAGLTMGSDGSYSFDPSNEAYQSLAEGEAKDVVASFTVTDDKGATSSSTLTITLTGTNDAPVATGTYEHNVTDTSALDTFSSLTGTLSATDVDSGDTLTWSGSHSGTYGNLTVNANGSYSYAVNAAAVNALQAGSNPTDSFTVTVTDALGLSSDRTIAVHVAGANDAPVATGTYEHTVNDTAALDVFTNLAGTLVATDIDSGHTTTWSGSAAGTYGSLTVNGNGTYSYAVNATAVNALELGDSGLDTFTATVVDEFGASSTRSINIHVVGANEADPNDYDNPASNQENASYGDSGANIITGNSNHYVLYGEAGNDTIRGGNDDHSYTMYGGSGNDTITGGSGKGNYTVYGGSGNDTITAGSGSGNYSVYGGIGHDTINGGSGDDTIHGGSGNDTISLSGGGNDVVAFDRVSGTGYDTITGFSTAGSGIDKIWIQGADTTKVNESDGSNAVFVTTAALTGTGSTFDLGALKDSSSNNFNTNAVDVIELKGGAAAYADLGTSTNGTELLKFLGVSGNAADNIKVDNSGDKAFVVAYDGGNGYLFHADAGSDNLVSASEIKLVGIFNGVAVDSFTSSHVAIHS